MCAMDYQRRLDIVISDGGSAHAKIEPTGKDLLDLEQCKGSYNSSKTRPESNSCKFAKQRSMTDTRSNTKARIGQVKIEQILVLSSSSKAAASEACIPRYKRPMSTGGACKPPPFSAAHFRHPLLFELPCFLDKVLDRVLRDVDVFCFEPRSNILWLSKASPQEFLFTIHLSRALLFNVDRT